MNSILEILEMSVEEIALQLTAYEELGSVGISELKKLVKDVLKDMDIDISDYNGFLGEYNYTDDEIFENDEEFFNMFFETNPQEAVRASYFGEYNFIDEYVKFDGYGNLQSSDYLDELMYMKDEYIEYWIENNIDFDDAEVEEIIKECNKLVRLGY